MAVACTDVFYEVGSKQDLIVLPLPILAPAAFKAVIGTRAHQLYIVTLVTDHQNDLGRPDINTSRHSRYKDIKSVSNSLVNFFFEVFLNGALVACQLFWTMTSKAYPVHPLFSFGLNSPPYSSLPILHHTTYLFSFQLVSILLLTLEVK